MLRTSVIGGAVAVALLIGTGSSRADGPKGEAKARPVVGQFRIGTKMAVEVKGSDDAKELSRCCWYRPYCYSYSYCSYPCYTYYRPCYSYSYYRPCCYYPTYSYYCLSGKMGSDMRKNGPRTSAERAEAKMNLPASMLNGK